jgi:site-specific recombinase XerD
VINQLFTLSSTIERLRQGPLSEHLDAYAAAVAEQGYAHHSIRQQIVVIADFSRWLKQKHIAVQALDSKVVDRFCDFAIGNSEFAEAIRKRCSDCWPCFARKAL